MNTRDVGHGRGCSHTHYGNEAVIVPRVRFVASMVIVLALVISVLIKNFLVEGKT